MKFKARHGKQWQHKTTNKKYGEYVEVANDNELVNYRLVPAEKESKTEIDLTKIKQERKM